MYFCSSRTRPPRMKFPPSKQARWPDSSLSAVWLKAARYVRSGRDDGWEARCAIVLSAARIQLHASQWLTPRKGTELLTGPYTR